MFLNVVFHHIRVCSGNQNLSFFEIFPLIANQHRPFQGLDNIRILGTCLRENAAVIYIHIGARYIPYCDQPLQHIVLCYGRNRHNTGVLHQIPCFFQGNILCYAFCLSYLYVLYLCFNCLGFFRSCHPEIIKHKLGLRIDVAGPARHIFPSGCYLLQIRVTDGRANGIRIRIFMPDYYGLFRFINCHAAS